MTLRNLWINVSSPRKRDKNSKPQNGHQFEQEYPQNPKICSEVKDSPDPDELKERCLFLYQETQADALRASANAKVQAAKARQAVAVAAQAAALAELAQLKKLTAAAAIMAANKEALLRAEHAVITTLDESELHTLERELSSSLGRITAEKARRWKIESDRQLCVVCNKNTKNIILMPCKHLCVCSGCASELIEVAAARKPLGMCPVCRAQIHDHVNILS